MTTIAAAPAPVLAVSVTDAAHKIGVSRSKLYDLFNRGELSWVQIGTRRLVAVGELERFLATHRVRRDSAVTGTTNAAAEGLPPATADAGSHRCRQPHRQIARRDRVCRPESG
jgi:excisionase family DNA binding protein